MLCEPRPTTRLASFSRLILSGSGRKMSGFSAHDLGSRVIPVIDLLSGQAVHAVRGRRSEYRPLESVLMCGSDPIDLAKALVERFGAQELYVADLDALQGGQPEFDLLRRIAELPVQLLVDLGMGSPEHVEQAMRELPYTSVCFVLATEASPDVETFRACLTELQGLSQAALGLDYLRGTFRTKQRSDLAAPSPNALAPEGWIDAALEGGVGSVIALDLDRVGSDRGFAWPAGLASSMKFGKFRRKISGGGIRSLTDVRDACVQGGDAVLVGSALHDGRIAPVFIDDRG
jgi:HisA/HisF family protein